MLPLRIPLLVSACVVCAHALESNSFLLSVITYVLLARISNLPQLAIGYHLAGAPAARLARWPVRVLPIDSDLSKACRRESAAHAGFVEQRETAVGGELFSSIAEKMMQHQLRQSPSSSSAGAAGGEAMVETPNGKASDSASSARSPPLSGRDSPEIQYRVASGGDGEDGGGGGGDSALTIATKYDDNGDDDAAVENSRGTPSPWGKTAPNDKEGPPSGGRGVVSPGAGGETALLSPEDAAKMKNPFVSAPVCVHPSVPRQ